MDLNTEPVLEPESVGMLEPLPGTELETVETWLGLRPQTEPESVLEPESVGMLEPLPGTELEPETYRSNKYSALHP